MARVLPTEPSAQPTVFLTCLSFGYSLSHEVRYGIFCLELVSKPLDLVVHSVVFRLERPHLYSACAITAMLTLNLCKFNGSTRNAILIIGFQNVVILSVHLELASSCLTTGLSIATIWDALSFTLWGKGHPSSTKAGLYASQFSASECFKADVLSLANPRERKATSHEDELFKHVISAQRTQMPTPANTKHIRRNYEFTNSLQN